MTLYILHKNRKFVMNEDTKKRIEILTTEFNHWSRKEKIEFLSRQSPTELDEAKQIARDRESHKEVFGDENAPFSMDVVEKYLEDLKTRELEDNKKRRVAGAFIYLRKNYNVHLLYDGEIINLSTVNHKQMGKRIFRLRYPKESQSSEKPKGTKTSIDLFKNLTAKLYEEPPKPKPRPYL